MGMTSATQVCVFALGCALIHVTRARSALVTRVLTVAAIMMAGLLLLTAWLTCEPGDGVALDGVTLFTAI